MYDEWRGFEQLKVSSIGDTYYVISHDVFTHVAVVAECERSAEHDYVTVDEDAMDVMARWWLERRGWQVSPPPPSDPQPDDSSDASSARHKDSDQRKAQGMAQRTTQR